MAEPAADVGVADVSPLRSWILRHPIATFLALVYATTTALVFVPKRADRAGTPPWRSSERKGWRAGPRRAQLPVAGAAALVSDQPARSAADRF
jgi:hypothetical protein